VLLITNSLAITFSQDKDLHIVVEDDPLYNHLELEPLLNAGVDDQTAFCKTALYNKRSEACALGMVLIVQFIG